MQIKESLIVSASLNLLLAAISAWLLLGKFTATPVRMEISPPHQIHSDTTPSTVFQTPPPTPFTWSRLQSDDLPTYIDNLRSIGCPEKTIRDIISTAIAARYSQKRQELNSMAATTSQQASSDPASLYEIQKELQNLDQQQANLTAQLLPPVPTPVSNESSNSDSNISSSSNSAQLQTGSQSGTQNTSTNTTRNASDLRRLFSPSNEVNQQELYRTLWGWEAFNKEQLIQETTAKSGQ